MSSFPTSDEQEGGTPTSPQFDPTQALPSNFEVRLLQGLTKRLLQRVEDPKVEISVAEMQLIRQLCESNSVSFASIKRGDFGQTAQRVAEEFPFDDDTNVVSLGKS